jgi:hypothetical protein
MQSLCLRICLSMYKKSRPFPPPSPQKNHSIKFNIAYLQNFTKIFPWNLTHSFFFGLLYHSLLGSGVALWLSRCTTSRTLPGSIPGDVTGLFSDIFPSDRTIALGSTQPLVKVSTRTIPGDKDGRCVRLKTHHFHVPNVMKSGSLNLLETCGPHRACYGTPLPLPLSFFVNSFSVYLAKR